eukprot:COSAG05_NODE_12929_length_448_cov_1.630372_1_plen_47_part_00
MNIPPETEPVSVRGRGALAKLILVLARTHSSLKTKFWPPWKLWAAP